MTEVTIKVYSKQNYETDSQEDTQYYKGTILTHERCAFLQYHETDTKTLIKIEENQLSVIKKGALQARLIFNKQQPSVAQYQTPFGQMQFDIDVQTLTIALGEITKISINYVLLNANEKISTNYFELTAYPHIETFQ